MLLAGEDTTSNTLAWMMYMMTEHPAVQARMQEEADRILGSAHRPADYASTGELRYIEAVAHETMRLKPVAPFLWLEPTEDIVIGDVHVPKGTAVNVLTAHVT
jgi:cytochrome P450